MSMRTFLCALAGVAVLAIGPASAATVFGSQFNHQLTPPEFCYPQGKKDHMCTWLMNEARGTLGEKAPKAGNIVKLRLVACAPGGTFVLQILRRGAGDKAKAIRTGPLINYKGTTRNCNASNNFDIEEFTINPGVPVRTGDSIGVVATKVSFMYNSSSGDSLLYDPPLADGQPNRSSFDGSGFLMFQVELDD